MTDSASSAHQPVRIDARGLLCPLPVIELARTIGLVAVGEAVEVIADDPAARHDVPAWCRMTGHALLSTTHAGTDVHFMVRRST